MSGSLPWGAACSATVDTLAQEQVFQALKVALSASAVLAFSDLNNSFVLQTDATEIGGGEYLDGQSDSKLVSYPSLPQIISY